MHNIENTNTGGEGMNTNNKGEGMNTNNRGESFAPSPLSSF